MNEIKIFHRRIHEWEPQFCCTAELLSSDNRGLKFQSETLLEHNREVLYFIDTESGMRPIQLLPGRSPKPPYVFQARWNEPLTEV
jgi:hypothetical protein